MEVEQGPLGCRLPPKSFGFVSKAQQIILSGWTCAENLTLDYEDLHWICPHHDEGSQLHRI